MNAEIPTPSALIKVLVVDDEQVMLKAFEKILDKDRFRVSVCDSPLEALQLLEESSFDVGVFDISMPQMSGMDLLRGAKQKRPEMEIIMMTAYATVDTAVQAVKTGAYDYLTKPFENIDTVALIVSKAAEKKRLIDRNRQLEAQLDVKERYEDLIGNSVKMREVFQMIESVSYSSCSVLIQGESGTGKELVARALHYRSPRKDKAFVVVNCAALAETLLESELFGHAKGSFTGAIADKPGLFELANGGTVFLDEIGEIPLSTQVKLLRVLQNGETKRVGSNETKIVDVRAIVATHVDLQKAKEKGTFREDLFYRLNVITIYLPALRERPEDIPLLAYHFLKSCNKKMGKEIKRIDPEAMHILQSYRWVGNVRELENVVERAVVLQNGEVVSPKDLPSYLSTEVNLDMDQSSLSNLPYKKAKAIAVKHFERRYIRALMRQSKGNISLASRKAGMDRSNFRRIVKKFNFQESEFEG